GDPAVRRTASVGGKPEGGTSGLPTGSTKLPVPAAPPRSADPPSPPGYQDLGELGRGGMGVVYKARHSQLNRIVAVKMILASGHAGEAELARFRAEAEAIARFQHPNIVQIFEIGDNNGVPFFS